MLRSDVPMFVGGYVMMLIPTGMLLTVLIFAEEMIIAFVTIA